MRPFPMTPDDEHEFYQFLHMHAVGYDFPGGYKLRPVMGLDGLGVRNGLWYAVDSIGHRLTDMGVWVGEPREEDRKKNWEDDTTHELKDAYELLVRFCGSLPALRRPRPSVARTP